MSWITLLLIAVLATAIAGGAWIVFRRGLRPVPDQLRPGSPLPEFRATNERGEAVHSADLRGAPTVILFVRGNWCPFCSRQVSNLTQHYRDILELGARLILVTPKPLQTTRRVAEFFEVDFDFWLDDGLAVTQQLGLLQKGGVPAGYDDEYGRDTTWPTALVVDAGGIIRYAELSKHISDRPDPSVLLREVEETLRT